MRLVVDANIMIAAFLRSAISRKLLLDDRLSLYAPVHSLSEVEHVLQARRLHRRLHDFSQDEILVVLEKVVRQIQMIPPDAFGHRLEQAIQLAPHLEDAPYLALALHLG